MKDPKINVERSILDVVLASFEETLTRLGVQNLIFSFEVTRDMIKVQPTFSLSPVFKWKFNIEEDL